MLASRDEKNMPTKNKSNILDFDLRLIGTAGTFVLFNFGVLYQIGSNGIMIVIITV